MRRGGGESRVPYFLGMIRYPEFDNMEILDKLIGEDYRLPAPGGCPANLHAIMLKCWEEDGEDRVGFSAARTQLEKLAESTPDTPVTLGEARGAVFDETDQDTEDGGEAAEDASGYAIPADS